jgi:hypothetical protein
METDRAYFRRRASEEHAAALKASDDRVRKAHRELAKGYDERLAQLGSSHAAAAPDLIGAA